MLVVLSPGALVYCQYTLFSCADQYITFSPAFSGLSFSSHSIFSFCPPFFHLILLISEKSLVSPDTG